MMNKLRLARAVALALLLLAAGTLLRAADATVGWRPVELTNGSPVLFRVASPVKLKSVSGTCLGHDLNFFFAPREKSWYALGGISLQTKPGTYELRVTETFANGRTREIERRLRVTAAVYPRITVKVAKQFTEPSQAQLSAIALDKNTKEKIFAAVSAQRLWSGPFAPPVSAPVSDVFGTERVFNGEVQSRHQGLDYAVPAGTPIRAIARGVVVLARPMFFEGNFIVIDHGRGLLSLYLHLSEFKVKEGETVGRGQVIALSGGSGRATGAHLHLAVRWQGVYISPAALLKLPIPSD